MRPVALIASISLLVLVSGALTGHAQAAETAAEAARTGNAERRQWAAAQPDLPGNLVLILANDIDPGVRRAIALRRLRPADVLAQLAQDGDRTVQQVFAQRDRLPETIQAILARIGDDGIRRALLERRDLASAVVIMLTGDTSRSLRLAAARHPNVPRSLGLRADTPPEALIVLADTDDPWLRWYVARHKAAPPTLLERLTGDADIRARSSVAGHPNTPANTLQERAGKEQEERVLLALGCNPHTPAECRIDLWRRGFAPGVRPQ